LEIANLELLKRIEDQKQDTVISSASDSEYESIREQLKTLQEEKKELQGALENNESAMKAILKEKNEIEGQKRESLVQIDALNATKSKLEAALEEADEEKLRLAKSLLQVEKGVSNSTVYMNELVANKEAECEKEREKVRSYEAQVMSLKKQLVEYQSTYKEVSFRFFCI